MIRKTLLLIALLCLSSPVFATNWCGESSMKMGILMDVDEDPLTDCSGEGNTGALLAAGEPNFATASPPDTFSTGYYNWDGNDDTVTVTDDNTLDVTTAYSFVSWFKAVSLPTRPGASAAWFIGKDTNTGRSYDFGIFHRADESQQNLAVQINGTNRPANGANTSLSVDSTWHHAAVTYNTANGVKYYLDGVADGTDGGADVNSTGTNLLIGARLFPGEENFWDGDLDETAIFNIELSSTDINDIMDNGLFQIAAATTDGITIYGDVTIF